MRSPRDYIPDAVSPSFIGEGKDYECPVCETSTLSSSDEWVDPKGACPICYGCAILISYEVLSGVDYLNGTDSPELMKLSSAINKGLNETCLLWLDHLEDDLSRPMSRASHSEDELTAVQKLIDHIRKQMACERKMGLG